jgi:hypothetical protein
MIWEQSAKPSPTGEHAMSTGEQKSSDDGKLLGLPMSAWLVLITTVGTSFVMPCLNWYSQYHLKLEQIKQGQKIEVVQSAVKENAEKHEQLAAELRTTAAYAASAMKPEDNAADIADPGPIEPQPAPQ